MLLTKVILKNYGVFRDENVFDFTCTPEKPIILIGGTNGSGKTTLFESVMLCLYGMSFLHKKTTRKTYEKYLSRKIHRYIGTSVSADYTSIIVEFKFFHDGKVIEYHVDRTWRNDEGKIVEELSIKKRNESGEKFLHLDTVEKSQWQSFIEELIPRGIAKLFFFDGEKIVRIAEEGNEEIEIKSSFDSLLGLDLIEQLRSDLQINLMRNLKGNAREIREEFEKLDKEKQNTIDEIGYFREKQAQKEAEISQILKEIDELEAKVSKLGGGYASKREELKTKKVLLEARLENQENKIRNLCAGVLPFSLVPKQLEEVKAQLKKDEEVLKKKFEKEILNENFEEIKSNIKSENFWKELDVDSAIKDRIISELSNVFMKTLESKSPNKEKGLFNFSVSETVQLYDMIGASNNVFPQQLGKVTGDYSNITEELQKIETVLINAPRDDEIGPLISKLNQKHLHLGTLKAESNHLEQQISSKHSYRKLLNFKLRNIIEEKYKHESADTKEYLTNRMLKVLDEYAERLKIKKLKLLEDYLLEAIHILMHKENFIENVSIDKETFEITLYRKNNDLLPRDWLSKGEQQMFATAVLWALAKTSGKPLPFMIDTPLARLDVEHRNNVVEEFFPKSSHQVILFATDSEIGASYYRKLMPYISRSYAMEYLPGKGKTDRHKTYFWNEKGEKIVAV